MAFSSKILLFAFVLSLHMAALAKAQAEQQAPAPVGDKKAETDPGPQPDSGDPGTPGPVADEPVAGEPDAQEPHATEPPAQEPAAQEPTAQEPAAREAAAQERPGGELAAEQAAGEQAAAEQAAPEQAATEEPTADTSDEIIMDPELDGLAPPEAAEPGSQPVEPSALTGELSVALRSRLAADIQWEDPREEVWEATQLALLEASMRRSERLRFVVGVRVRHQFASLERDTDDAEAERFELDAAPTGAYADATLSDGLYLRVGYQNIQLGRFDAFSASNFLAVVDLRNGPVTMPEAMEVAQPALKVDWDPLAWLTLRAVYVPFFQPHVVSLFDTDYSLVPGDSDAVEGAAMDELLGPAAGTPEAENLQRLLRQYLPRSARSRIADSGFSAFAPDPTLAHPQGAVCATAHGAAGEVGLTLGSGLERFPALRLSQSMADIVEGRAVADPATLLETAPVEVLYERFAVFAVDGATDIGPVQVGAEAAYMLDRTFFAARTGFWPQPERADMAQVGLRAEYIGDTEWILALEGFFAYALQLPSDADREWLMLEEGRYLRGAATLISWSPPGTRWTFETGAGVYSGPSYLIAPRVELRLVADLYAEVGALFVGGPTPPTTFGSPELALGGQYDGIDQAFVGLRWLP